MAKLSGPLGSKLHGKVGEVVAAKTVGGFTAIRAYQPRVKNPNTARQKNSRMRFSVASKLAASLAQAIQIGFAKACAGASMYPRNLFVSGIVPSGTDSPITVAGGVATVDYAKVDVSKKVGLLSVPTSAPSLDGQGNIAISQSVPAEASQITGGKYGFVVVLYNPVRDEIIIRQTSTVAEGEFKVVVEVPGTWSGAEGHAWGFYKVVPDSMNDIATDTLPWKFPSETGASAYLGSFEIV